MEQTVIGGWIHTWRLLIAPPPPGFSIQSLWLRHQLLITSLRKIYFKSSFSDTTSNTYCCALGSIMSSGDQGGGWEGLHIHELNKGWMSKPGVKKRREPVCMTEQEEGKHTNEGRPQRLRLHYTAEMPMHATNTRTITMCIKESAGVLRPVTCRWLCMDLDVLSYQTPGA